MRKFSISKNSYRRFACSSNNGRQAEAPEGAAQSQLFQKVKIGFCNLEKLKKREFNFLQASKSSKNMNDFTFLKLKSLKSSGNMDFIFASLKSSKKMKN
eukprot:UN21990